MNYDAALILKMKGLESRDRSFYENHLWQKFDLDMFIMYLDEQRENVDYDRFFDNIRSKI